MTDHCLLLLLLVASAAVQCMGLAVMGVMAWQGRAEMRESQRLTESGIPPWRQP